jgi:peptide/nickel transport system substrate-binding protein
MTAGFSKEKLLAIALVVQRRPTRRRLTALTAAVAISALALTGCSGGHTAAKVSNSLTFGAIAAPPTLNPATGDPAYGATYQWAYDPLIVLQPDGSYAPGLATKWGYAGQGNKVYQLTFRSGVKFSDGTPLDAQAVKTYLDYERSQKIGSMAPLLVNVSDIQATGPLTLRIDLKTSDPSLTFDFAQGFGAGYIASPKAVANPDQLNKGTYGAGPYMVDLSKSVPGDHYAFVQNPYYWNKKAQHWKTVTERVIPNPSAMVQAMQAGQVQAALGDATTLTAAKNAGLTVIAPPQAMTGLNLMDRSGSVSKPLGDVRVRQALNYAVDRKAIAKALYGNESLSLSQYALEGQAGYDASLNDKYPYDPKKAKQLLAEAGYPNGFTLPVLDTSVASLDKVIQAIAGQLKSVGVTLQITTKPSVNDFVVAMLSQKFPAAVEAYGLATMSSLFAGYVNPAGPFNPFHVTDPELDALYAKYYSANEKDGAALQKQINARLVTQGWSVPVVGAPLSYYEAKGITGTEATSANGGVPHLTEIRPSN